MPLLKHEAGFDADGDSRLRAWPFATLHLGQRPTQTRPIEPDHNNMEGLLLDFTGRLISIT